MAERLVSVGERAPRVDAVEKVTGSAKYATDLRLDRMLFAKVLRSPHPHARVRRVDKSAAEKVPGVRAVATLFEVPKVLGYWFSLRTEQKKEQMFLRDDVVRFVGDVVAAVAAEDEAAADEALALLEVDYEVLPPVLDPLEALAEGAPRLHGKGNLAFETRVGLGDTDRGFAEADVVVEAVYRTSKQKHAPLEPLGTCVADYRPNGRLTVWSSTQLPHWSREYVAGALGLPLNRVRLVKPFTGGSFGGRCGLVHGLEVTCAWLSRKAGRPVKLSFDRHEDLTATESRHPMTLRMKTGCTRDGLITAHEVDVVSDVGAYGTHYVGVLADCVSVAVGLYRTGSLRFHGRAVCTNKSLTGAMRGYGHPQMNFAQESQLDALAARLGLDPLELRLRNYRKLGETVPVLNEEIRSNGLPECLERGAASAGWEGKRAAPAAGGATRRGIGVAAMMHGSGAVGAMPDPASALVYVTQAGTAHLVSAVADDGQGSRTVFAQIVAEVLGIAVDNVSVSEPDTDTTPLDCGTHGSRQAYTGGLAVKAAATDAKQKILGYGARVLGVPAEGLRLEGGAVFDAGSPEKRISLADLMRRTQVGDLTVCEQVMGSATGLAPCLPGSYGAVFAEVEVDVETGHVRVLRLTSAFDVGHALNPDNVEGQIAGGAAMGIGFALTEGLALEDGRIVNGSFCDYRLVRSCDVPEIVPILVESNEPTGPFGAKGVGEAALVNVASAIANAIFHATGARLTEVPFTPERVLEALRAC